MSEFILGIMVLAALALIWGGITLLQRARATGESKTKPVLMLVLAVIILGNVAIWTVPDESGKAPINSADLDESADR